MLFTNPDNRSDNRVDGRRAFSALRLPGLRARIAAGTVLSVLAAASAAGCVLADETNKTGFAQCEEYINVRSDASTDSEVVGKLYNNGKVEITGMSSDGNWYHIRSGNVEGYVSSELIATGDEAAQIAESAGYTTAECGAEVLNVRASMSEDSEIVGAIFENGKYEVVDDQGDWVKVVTGDGTYGWVSCDYVYTSTEYGQAETLEEEQARLDQQWLDYLAAQEAASYDSGDYSDGSGSGYSEAAALQDQADNSWDAAAQAQADADAAAQAAADAAAQAAADYQAYLDAQAAADAASSSSGTDGSSGSDDGSAQSAADEAYQAYEASQAEADAQAQASYDAQYAADEAYQTADSAQTAADEAYSSADASQTYTEEASSGDGSGSSSSGGSTGSYSAGSSTGQAVANYACQFVGGPYIYGGTSLTGGADCSGFVMSVYANFGVSLPHNAAAQSGYGTAVDASSLAPGDLVFYSNGSGISHVAIYIGGGSIVHAANSASGICYGNLNYNTPVAYRRLV